MSEDKNPFFSELKFFYDSKMNVDCFTLLDFNVYLQFCLRKTAFLAILLNQQKVVLCASV